MRANYLLLQNLINIIRMAGAVSNDMISPTQQINKENQINHEHLLTKKIVQSPNEEETLKYKKGRDQ